MTAQRVKLRLPLSGGLDYHLDPVRIQPPKLLECLNGTFRVPGRIETRYGLVTAVSPNGWDNVAGATVAIAGAFGLASLNGAPVLLAHEGLFVTAVASRYGGPPTPWRTSGRMPLLSLDYIQTRWRGSAPNAVIDNMDVGLNTNGISESACAAIESAGVIYLVVLDLHSGNQLAQYTVGSLGAGTQVRPRVIMANNILYCLFATSGGKLGVASLDFGTLPNPGTIAPTALEADLDASMLYDADDALGGSLITVAYYTTTANTIRVFRLTAGAVGASTTIVTGSAPSTVGVAAGGFGSVVAWTEGSTVKARGYDTTLALKMATTTINPSGLPAGTAGNITAVFTDATHLVVFWELAGATPDLNVVSRGRLTWSVSDGAVAGAVSADMGATGWLRHSGLASKAWKATNGLAYVIVVHASTIQTTYYVVAMQFSAALDGTHASGYDPLIVAQIYPGTAKGVATWLPNARYNNNWTPSTPGAAAPTIVGLSQQRLLASGALGAGYLVAIDDGARQPSSAEAGRMLYFPGGIVWEFDGLRATENGFLLAPEGAVLTSTTVGGGALIAGQSYSYLCFYEAHNAFGQRRISGMTAAVTGICTGNAMQLSIPTLAHTNRAQVGLAVYRQMGTGEYRRVSLADPGGAAGTNGYCGAGVNDHTNPGSTDDVAIFVDGMAELTALANEEAPTDGEAGQPLDNVSPPSCKYIAAGNDRLYVSGLLNPDEIWASKPRSGDEAADFTDVGTIVLPSGIGPVTSLATVMDALVAFRSSAMYVIAGQGPDETGVGEFSTPRLETEALGCRDQVSIARLPGMLAFRATGVGGIYGWSPGQGFKHIGEELSGERDEVTAFAGSGVFDAPGMQVVATVVADLHQLRYSLANPSPNQDGVGVLVYDYLAGQWARWALGSGAGAPNVANPYSLMGGATVVNILGRNVFAILCAPSGQQSHGEILVDDTNTNCVDKIGGASYAFDMIITWPWITPPDGLADNGLLYKLQFYGGMADPGSATVEIAWDPHINGPYDRETHTIAIDGFTIPFGYVFEVRPNRHRFQSCQVKLTAVSPFLGNAAISLTELVADIGVLPGMAKLPATRRL